MVITTMERAFPRGGKDASSATTSTSKSVTKKKSFDLFGKVSVKKSKPKKIKEKTKNSQAKGDIPKVSSVEPLSYKILSEDLLVLGCISEIRQYDMWISLPGRIVGRVPITGISSQYTKALQTATQNLEQVKPLEEMFCVGQHVVTKITELSTDGDRTNVVLTLMPNEIHSELVHSVLAKGMVLTGALSSIEDHGYLIDFGIKSVRAFLKKRDANSYIEKLNHGKPLGIGQLIRCLIKTVSSTASNSTIQITVDPEQVEAAIVPPLANINPHLVLPGMRFQASVTQLLHDGIQIKWQNFEGLVYRDHLPDPCQPPENQTSVMESSVVATVLYTLPIVRSVHFTLQNPPPFSSGSQDITLEKSEILLGQTVTNAEVIYANFRGICVKLNKSGIRGFVSISHVADFGEVSEDMRAKYPPKTRLTCRVLKYDTMDHIFICTMQKSLLSEKLLVMNDLKPGMPVQCRVVEIKKAGILVQIGHNPQLKALVPTMHISDSEISDVAKRYPCGHQVRGKILKVDSKKQRALITLKPSLVKSESPIITSYEEISKKKWYDGTVVWIGPRFYLVAFYNDVVGKLNSHDIPGQMGASFSPGKVISCRVIECDSQKSKLKLSMVPFEDDDDREGMSQISELQIGQEFDVKILQVTKEGLHVKVCTMSGVFAHIPQGLTTEHTSLAESLLTIYSPGMILKATFILPDDNLPIFTLNKSLIEAVKESNKKIQPDSVLPGFVEGVTKSGVLVNVCVDEPNRLVFVPFRALTNESVENSAALVKNGQGLLCRITSVKSEEESSATFRAVASASLIDVWSGSSYPSMLLLESYIDDYRQIFHHLQKTKNPLCSLKQGQIISGTVIQRSGESTLVQLEGGITGHISSYHSKGIELQVGQKLKAMVVLWLDVTQKLVELSLRTDVMKNISRIQENCTQPSVSCVYRGEIVFVKDEFVLYALKGKCHGVLSFGPSRRHINDFLPPSHCIGEVKKVIVTKVDSGYILCGTKKELCEKKAVISKVGKQQAAKTKKLCLNKEAARIVHSVPQKLKRKRTDSITSDDGIGTEVSSEVEPETVEISKKKKKKKKQEKKEMKQNLPVNDKGNLFLDPEQKLDVHMDCDAGVEVKQLKKKKKRSKRDSQSNEGGLPSSTTEEVEVTKPQVLNTENLPTLDVEGFVWDVNAPADAPMDSSSDESDEEKVPKKRLTLAEKREIARKEEEHLIQTEQRLMDESRAPQSADDFDRLVMASPDSSIIWVQYMAFHLQATEIEKARAVAAKALKTISFREEQEKLNVWVALLNLENLYGTQESLDKALQQAIQLNDAYKVYTHMLQIFTETNKVEEGDALFDKMLRKFRADKDVWLQGGTYYLATQQVEKARALLQQALRSLDIKHHVDVICKFAYLENRHGDQERAHTLFEHVLSSFPRRVDVWCSYVDLLLKADNVNAARQVLERGVSQKLPARKMKVLFKKFMDFELQHGTEERVEMVRNMAQEYVKSITSSLTAKDNDD